MVKTDLSRPYFRGRLFKKTLEFLIQVYAWPRPTHPFASTIIVWFTFSLNLPKKVSDGSDTIQLPLPTLQASFVAPVFSALSRRNRRSDADEHEKAQHELRQTGHFFAPTWGKSAAAVYRKSSKDRTTLLRDSTFIFRASLVVVLMLVLSQVVPGTQWRLWWTTTLAPRFCSR